MCLSLNIANMDEEKNEWLAQYYSPSKWNNRMDPGGVVDYHVNICTGYSETTRKSSHCELSVCYGEKKAKMDIFYPAEENDDTAESVHEKSGSSAAVVLFVHGGYWQEGSRKIYSFVSESWTKNGCVAAVVGYNLAPEASLDQMVGEIQSAVKYINTRFPKSRLFLCGHSAGAHLCAMMMVSDWSKDPSIPQAIHGMFLLSGVFDLVPIVSTYVNDALKLTEESAAQVSPQKLLTKMSPTFVCPILVVMEEYGSPEFFRQAKEFVEILKSHKVQCCSLELPGVDHFSMIENMVNSDDLLCQEILKVIRNINSAKGEKVVKIPNSGL